MRQPEIKCEQCEAVFDSDIDPDYFNDFDEPICENCRQSANERAWERHCEDFHDGGSTRFISLQQQQEAARRLK
jgi:hypothetical protein